MNTKQDRKRLVVGGVVAGGAMLLGAGLVIGAGVARADYSDVAFLQALNRDGISIYDTGAALRTGYTVCAHLSYSDGLETARWLYVNSSYSDVPSMTAAAEWVIDSAMNLCPWTYHPGTSNNTTVGYQMAGHRGGGHHK